MDDLHRAFIKGMLMAHAYALGKSIGNMRTDDRFGWYDEGRRSELMKIAEILGVKDEVKRHYEHGANEW